MTDLRSPLGRTLFMALLVLTAAGPLAAQDAGSLDDRERRAFGVGAPERPSVSPGQQAEAEATAGAAAERLGVELIRTSVLEVHGRRLIAARVMEPGGDSNVAFLVQTLVLDPASGDVLGVFPATGDEVMTLEGFVADAPLPADEPATGEPADEPATDEAD